MPNYQDGYIYKLWSLQTEEIYIGSSTTEPRKRLCDHKAKYRRFLEGRFKYLLSSYKIVQYPDCKIEIIEKYPCNSKAELCKREGEHQRATKCCNTEIAGRTNKEYYEDTKDKRLKEGKEYYKKNKNTRAKTMKIYNEKKINKDNKKNYNKEYYENNKDKILKHTRERYQEKKKEKEKSNIEFLKIKIIKKG